MDNEKFIPLHELQKSEIIDILESMDIPKQCQDISSMRNLQWLKRNAWIRNGHHNKLNRLMELITIQIRGQND